VRGSRKRALLFEAAAWTIRVGATIDAKQPSGTKTANGLKKKSATMESDEILTVEEVAALLKIHPKTVYKFLKANELQGHRFGRLWRFKKSEIMKLLETRDALQ
jgi:excisionase family DNA binding protein